MPSDKSEKTGIPGSGTEPHPGTDTSTRDREIWHDILVLRPNDLACRTGDRSDLAPEDSERGVAPRPASDAALGEDRNVIAAKTLARTIADVTADHSEQSRRLTETLLNGPARRTGPCKEFDLAKIQSLAARIGIDTKHIERDELVRRIANEALGDHSRIGKEPLSFAATTVTRQRLSALLDAGLMPNNIDRAIENVMHRTSSECNADPMPIIFEGITCCVADYDSMRIITDLSDIIRGTPELTGGGDALATMHADRVNIAINDLVPSLRERIAQAAKLMNADARKAGASGIDIVLVGPAKSGLPGEGKAEMPGLSLDQALASGMVDALVADHRCLPIPLIDICACEESETNARHQFGDEDVEESARMIVRTAIEAFKARAHVAVGAHKALEVITGFSLEQIEALLAKLAPADPLAFLIEAIQSGRIRGIALMTGCNCPGSHDSGNLSIAKELLRNDVLVLSAGCLQTGFANEGLYSSAAVKEFAGEGLRSFIDDVSEASGISLPAVWHIGSCSEITRGTDLAMRIARHLGTDVSSVPLAVSAPGANREKIVGIGAWSVALGAPVHIDGIDFLKGASLVAEVLTNTARDVLGGNFIVEADPGRAAKLILNEIERRRWHLKLNHTYQVPRDQGISQERLYRKATEGALIATGYASQLLSSAIARYGPDEEVEFPETAYALPAILAWEGREIHKLGDMPIALEQARSLIKATADLEGALSAGESVMIAAEIIEALKYVRNERPYEGTPFCGFIPDKVIRELGIAIVDDTIPGCAVLVGAAKDPKQLVKIVRDCQSKGMLIMASYDTIRQLQDEGIKTGLDMRLYPIGEFTQVVHALNFAIRVALTFGGVQRGDRERLAGYLVKRPKVFVLQLGPMDAIKIAAEFAVLLNGSPTITDQDVEGIPDKFVSQPSYEHMVQTAIELRGIQVKLAPVALPVAYGPAFEGETVRRPDTYVEAGGAAHTLAFEMLRQRPESEVEDGKITVIGEDLDRLPEGSKTPLAIVVDVYGKKMQSDFESVLERRIHQFLNFAEGVWHTGQRNTIWVRISKTSVKSGFRFKHFGDILVAKIKGEFGNIVSRVQVTIITDEEEAGKLLPVALEKYRVRDQRLAGLTDESVNEFYSCQLCQSLRPRSHLHRHPRAVGPVRSNQLARRQGEPGDRTHWPQSADQEGRGDRREEGAMGRGEPGG